MNGHIVFLSSDRVRIHLDCGRMTFREADILEYLLEEIPGVRRAYAYDISCDVAVAFDLAKAQKKGNLTAAEALYEARHDPRPFASERYKKAHPLPEDKARSKAELAAVKAFRKDVIEKVCAVIAAYKGATPKLLELVPENPSRQTNREYVEKLIDLVALKLLRDFILPNPISIAWTVVQTARYITRGIRSLKSRQLKVEVLDAVSVTVSVARADFSTASTIMFLLSVGELMEEWTRKRSISDLAQRMSLNIDRVWLIENGEKLQVPAAKIKKGDVIHIHTGCVIPFDGKVCEGNALINQASMTGEAMPVHKSCGDPLYAGTVLAEGECSMTVTEAAGDGRYDKIIKMIEDSQRMKSVSESKAINLADRLVPLSLGGTAAVWALTGDVNRAVSVLMVDYSCALKLAIPLTVLSAMSECGGRRIVVKGGKYLENIAKADTIVFDKTGTLTRAVPKVAQIVPFGGFSETEILKIAACLEEHYPHSMANAVVEEAVKREISHTEMHSEVEYVVAHGIASRIGKERAVIGSAHFVFEDEGCAVPDGDEEKFKNLPDEYSHLYLAINNRLAGVICILDPLREETAEVLWELRALGIKNIVMMTGDSEKTAAAIADKAGVDSYFSEVFPADKADFIKSEKARGRTVIMVGDGINDSPALSEADVGIAISDGAAIARQVADITVRADSLFELVYLRKLAVAMRDRLRFNYRFVGGFNSMLMVLGALGILQPSVTAMLHNISTIGISLKSMQNLIEE